MKPSVSALNDWLKTIIVHKSFNNLHIIKNEADYATIELCYAQQYSYASNHYEFTCIASISIADDVVDGKIKNVVFFRINTPTGFVNNRTSTCKSQRFTNITLKNLIEFVDFFKDMCKPSKDSLYRFYNIPNHNNMGFTHDYKPFEGNFKQYFNDHKEEYDKFIEQREILFSFLEKNSKINEKKKAIKKDFVKSE